MPSIYFPTWQVLSLQLLPSILLKSRRRNVSVDLGDGICGFYANCCINFIIPGHTFGFHRAEVIAALVSVFTIWILTAFLVREAIERVKNPQHIDAKLVSEAVFLLFHFAQLSL